MRHYLEALKIGFGLAARFRRDERGSYLVITALMTPALIGIVGLSADYGLWMQKHRSMQNAADSAAASAAMAYAVGNMSSEAQANGVASTFGFVSGTDGVTVTVNRPPASGNYTSKSNAVEVIISGTRKPYFSAIFSPNSGSIQARAVGIATGNGTGCVLALDTTANGATTDDGNTNVALNGCSLYDNSSSSSALRVVGGATLTAKSVSVVGDIFGRGQITTTDGIYTGQGAAADPYSGIVMPTPTGPLYTNCCNDGNYGPGVYKNGIKLTGHTNVDLSPGVYYLQGDLDISGGSTLTGTGVTLVFTSNGGSSYAGASINGGATVSLTAPTSGTFSGIAMFGDRDMTLGKQFTFNGGSTKNFVGAVYIPKGSVKYAGGSSNAAANKCTQLIADTVEFTGNAQFNVNCTGIGTSTITSLTAQIVE